VDTVVNVDDVAVEDVVLELVVLIVVVVVVGAVVVVVVGAVVLDVVVGKRGLEESSQASRGTPPLSRSCGSGGSAVKFFRSAITASVQLTSPRLRGGIQKSG